MKKQVIVAVFGALLILFGAALQAAVSSFTGPLSDLPYYVGAPQPYSYIITHNSTHTLLFNGTTGYNTLTHSNASKIFLETMDENCSVMVHSGNYSIDVALTIGANVSYSIEGHSRQDTILYAAATMDYLIGNTDNETDYVSIKNLFLQCGHSGGLYKANHGILLHNNDQTYAPSYQHSAVLENLLVMYAGDYGINLTNPMGDDDFSSATLENCMVRDGKGGFWIDWTDSTIMNCMALALANDTTDAYEAALYLNRGSNIVTVFYAGGGYKHGIVIASTWNTLSTVIIDSTRWHGLLFDGGSYNTLSTFRVSQVSRGANETYCGVFVGGGSDYNVLSCFTVGTRAGDYVPSRWLWEPSGSDYNIYTSWVFMGEAKNANYTLSGTGSIMNFTQIDPTR